MTDKKDVEMKDEAKEVKKEEIKESELPPDGFFGILTPLISN